MIHKTISTIVFREHHRHTVNRQGWTLCSIWIRDKRNRRREQKPQGEVNCWKCRRKLGLLKPKRGKVQTVTMKGCKIHTVSEPSPKRPGDIKTPCGLDFGVFLAAIDKL